MTTWRDRFFKGTVSRGDAERWRLRAFHGSRCRCPTCAALPAAPHPSTPSAAMLDVRDEDRREREAAERFERETTAALRDAWRRRRLADLRALVDEFGAEVVERIERRRDPSFTLPDELKGER